MGKNEPALSVTQGTTGSILPTISRLLIGVIREELELETVIILRVRSPMPANQAAIRAFALLPSAFAPRPDGVEKYAFLAPVAG